MVFEGWMSRDGGANTCGLQMSVPLGREHWGGGALLFLAVCPLSTGASDERVTQQVPLTR